MGTIPNLRDAWAITWKSLQSVCKFINFPKKSTESLSIFELSTNSRKEKFKKNSLYSCVWTENQNMKCTNVLILQKPVNWFTLQINLQVSKWWEHLSITVFCTHARLNSLDETLYSKVSYTVQKHRQIKRYCPCRFQRFARNLNLPHFYTPWKCQKKQVSEVFRRYRNVTLD